MCACFSERKDKMMRILVFLMVLACFLLSCHDGCVEEETKCDGTKVMICDGEKDWHVMMNCAAVEPVDLGWTCCPFENDFACIPQDECVLGGDE